VKRPIDSNSQQGDSSIEIVDHASKIHSVLKPDPRVRNGQSSSKISILRGHLARILGRSKSSPACLDCETHISCVSHPFRNEPGKASRGILGTSHSVDQQEGESERTQESYSHHGSETTGEDYDISAVFREEDVSDGSEIEVEGGVALTEEAVEERLPDIITQV
jgi:hypothetical protein